MTDIAICVWSCLLFTIDISVFWFFFPRFDIFFSFIWNWIFSLGYLFRCTGCMLYMLIYLPNLKCFFYHGQLSYTVYKRPDKWQNLTFSHFNLIIIWPRIFIVLNIYTQINYFINYRYFQTKIYIGIIKIYDSQFWFQYYIIILRIPT